MSEYDLLEMQYARREVNPEQFSEEYQADVKALLASIDHRLEEIHNQMIYQSLSAPQ